MSEKKAKAERRQEPKVVNSIEFRVMDNHQVVVAELHFTAPAL